MAKRRAKPPMHLLRVQLRRIEPPIWRDFLIPSDVTLDWLHVAIQMAMPWMDTHIHVFEIGKSRVSNPEFEVSSGPESDEGMFTVGDVLPHVGSRITYLYDLGDDWEHDVELRDIRQGEKQGFLCLDGERAAPPEDCGGPPGYERLLLALAHPNHLDHAELTSWLTQQRAEFAEHDERFLGEHDPERFDLGAVNRALSKLRIEYDIS